MTKNLPLKNQPNVYEEASSRKMEQSDQFNKPYDTQYDSYRHNFLKGMRVFWATKHTEDTANDRQLYIKTTVRELIVYIGFLIVIMIISYGMVNNLTYYYTNSLNGIFMNPFASGANVDDYWKYLNGPLMSGLYLNQWYNNASVPNSDINYILYTNKLIGVPRLRQVRVRNDSCAIVTDFQSDLKLCYGPYSSSIESTDAYGPANSTAWNYTTEKKLNGRQSEGYIANYGGGGYYVDLNQTKEDSLNTIGFLFNNLWIDRGTRAVLLDFTVYNANLNLFCVIKLIAEFPATGGMNPVTSSRTVKLIRYVTPVDYLLMTFELIFLVYIIYYVVEEAIEIRKHKLSYFSSLWNCLDIFVIVISLLAVGFNIYRTISVNNLLQNLLSSDSKYPNFDNLSYLQVQCDYIIAFTMFFAWVKIFKYISFNQTMSQMNETLSRCACDLSGFTVMFLVIFIGFVQLGYLMFGTQVDGFSTFITTAFTLLQILLSAFDFSQLDRSNRILGPIYFVLYVFFVMLVLFNMFLSIVVDTYCDVKADLATKSNEFDVADYIKERARVVLSKINFKIDRVIDIQDAMAMADTDGDNKIDFEEWKTELRKRGYADAEIEAVFNRYDKDGDQVLDQSERRQMQTELECQKAALNQEIKESENNESLGNSFNGVTVAPLVVEKEQYEMLDIRMNRMKKTIKTVIKKIDNALKNFGDIEKSNSRKRETLGRILKALKSTDNLSDAEGHKLLVALVKDEIDKMKQGDCGSKFEADYQG